MRKFKKVFTSMPKRRMAVYLFLSVIFAYFTKFVFQGFFQYLFLSSVTLTSLDSALADIIGPGKYYTYLHYFDMYSKGIFFFIFMIYIYLFYRYEKKKQYLANLNNILKETSFIAEGNFEHQLTVYDNNLDGLVKNIHNIVDRLKEAIEEERHIEHTKNELITNVSHDLRTPLTSIVGYLRLIEQDNYKDEVALRHYTGIAYDKALSLEQLINELFEYTRIQDKQLQLNMQPINIAEILGQVIVQNQVYFIENEMICREEFANVTLTVLGDGERLARVFNNLILNAIHYGKEGKYVDILTEDFGSEIAVTVTNYGNPISSIDLPHLFERFYRIEKSRAKHTGGSGLGLAISRSIVLRHNGTIDVESNLDRTSFIVKLPKYAGEID
ncbi:sensor histidine kinase [Pseudogracilibacillus auburnensis]|uniref:histidine kinase n=1 Tax=Pseudogracilibacillus auburnensis TaxID=1494959 RepID=A0A2V3W746_9BACI|nr:HAMP domain-containing sensor histidine kinase [Pseudogracilibacillus auburnensis]PXW88075.1 signal transduction histidine kinase [Pseudogracilibacillus auburnensis]